MSKAVRKKEKSPSKSQIHANHRSRLRKRIENNGIQSLEEHVILEYLLFHSIPRMDTNEIAHALILKFGSLSNVLNADPSELVKVDGIGAKSAEFLSKLSEILDLYMAEKLQDPIEYPDRDNVHEKLLRYFEGKENEETVVFFYQGDRQISMLELGIPFLKLGEKELKAIATNALSENDTGIIISHNRPGKKAKATKREIDLTFDILETLSAIDIPLLEHIVVSGQNYYDVLKEYEANNK